MCLHKANRYRPIYIYICPPYFFSSSKIEISRSRKSRSENMPPEQSSLF